MGGVFRLCFFLHDRKWFRKWKIGWFFERLRGSKTFQWERGSTKALGTGGVTSGVFKVHINIWSWMREETTLLWDCVLPQGFVEAEKVTWLPGVNTSTGIAITFPDGIPAAETKDSAWLHLYRSFLDPLAAVQVAVNVQQQMANLQQQLGQVLASLATPPDSQRDTQGSSKSSKPQGSSHFFVFYHYRLKESPIFSFELIFDCEFRLLFSNMFKPGVHKTTSIWRVYMDVSENSGTLKSSILIGFSIINHPFWGTPIFGNTHMCLFGLWLLTFCHWQLWKHPWCGTDGTAYGISEAGESEHPTDDEAVFEGDSGPESWDEVALVDIGNDADIADDEINLEIIFQWLPGYCSCNAG